MTRILCFVLVFVVALAVVVGAAAAWMVSYLEEPYRGYAEAERVVEVLQGANPDVIADQLVTAGVVRDRWTFKWALWRSADARRLQAGEYRFTDAMSAAQVVQKLASGDVLLERITFVEGLTIREMAPIFEAQGLGGAASFEAAAKEAGLIAGLDPEARDLEGYLFPDTYAVPRNVTAVQLVRAMVARFEQALDETLRAEATARGLSVREVVTLASLIEEETARSEERAVVAAVYTNRLKLGMGLQCDPTVIYALQLAGRYDGNLRRVDLAFDSLYNTYRYRGLPPGPIAAPGRASLEAALRPAEVDYLYFVSRNDGTHVFARSLREHNRNVREYQVRYFRERR